MPALGVCPRPVLTVPGAGLRQCLQVTDRPCGCAGGRVTQPRLPGRDFPPETSPPGTRHRTLDIGQVGPRLWGAVHRCDESRHLEETTPTHPFLGSEESQRLQASLGPSADSGPSLPYSTRAPGWGGGHSTLPVGGPGLRSGWVGQCSLPVGALGLPELTALRCRNQLCSDEKTGEKGSCSSPVLVLKEVLTWEEKTSRHSHWALDLPARVHSGVSAGWAGLRCDQVHHC